MRPCSLESSGVRLVNLGVVGCFACFLSGCGFDLRDSLLIAAESGLRTAVDVFVSDFYTDLPEIFTFPPPGGEPDPNDDDMEPPVDPDGDDEPPPDDDTPPIAGDPAAGESIFMINSCGLCHCEDAVGDCLPGAPALVNASADLLESNLIGDDPHVGGKLPELTAQDLADLAAFLADVAP